MKKTKCPKRDLGPDNTVRRGHLDLWKKELPSFMDEDNVNLLQRIVNRVEHKFEHCEKFLSHSKDDLKVSYYADGYYNGRARAFEEVIDLIEEIVQKSHKDNKLNLKKYGI